MQAPLLISNSDFAGFVDLPANLNVEKKLNQHILHAQEFDLAKLMGNKFYAALINNYASSNADPKVFTAPFLDLFDGVTYTYENVPYIYEGLKPVLVYFAAARLVKELDMHITPNGIMYKRNEYSDHAENKDKVFRANGYENLAIAYWNKSEIYLNANQDLFTGYWGNNCGCIEKTNYRPKLMAIGNNDYNYGRSDFYNSRR